MTYDYKEPVKPMFWLAETQTNEYDDPAMKSDEIWSHYLYNIVIWAPGDVPAHGRTCTQGTGKHRSGSGAL